MSIAVTILNNFWKKETPVPPTLLFKLLGEDRGAPGGTPFSASFGGVIVCTGSMNYYTAPTLNNRFVVVCNDGQENMQMVDSPSDIKQNYAIFSVSRWVQTVATGLVLDFRDGTNYKLILPAGNTNTSRNGWYYGQTSGSADLSDIVGENTKAFKIRCWLFEDNSARLYLGGGTAVKSGSFEDTDLSTTRKIGFTPTTNCDVEIGTIQIYGLPLNTKFTAGSLNTIGREIETYYGSVASASWTDIIV